MGWCRPEGLIIAGTLLAGCRCGGSAPASDGRPPHYEGFDVLVDLAGVGDRESAAKVARDLQSGADGDGDGVGGALGFVQLAEDAAELADGVAAAAEACGACHAERGVMPLDPRPAWGEANAVRWAVWGLVWNETSAPPEGAASWNAPVDSDSAGHAQRARVARMITAAAGD